MSEEAEMWYKVAVNIAGWLMGQDRKAAMRYIQSVKESHAKKQEARQQPSFPHRGSLNGHSEQQQNP
jgi:hypothetical protein